MTHDAEQAPAYRRSVAGHPWLVNASAKIDEVHQYLTGTANTLQHAMFICGVPEAQLDELRHALSDRCFCCDSCGWWHDAGDEGSSNGGEQVCPDCAGDES